MAALKKNIFILVISLITSVIIYAQPKIHTDILLGSSSSDPSFFAEYKGKLYFSAYDGKNGTEIWEYDGINPPKLSYDLFTSGNSKSSNPSSFIVFNDKLYFSARTDTVGYEIWEYDGTNPPTLIEDINKGVGSSLMNEPIVFKGKLYFEATDGSKGYELYSLDSFGKVALVEDLNIGFGWGNPTNMVIYHDTLFFRATESSGSVNLPNNIYYYTGKDSIQKLSNISNGYVSGNLTVFNDKLYFVAYESLNYGIEIFSYDGNTGKIGLAADINPGVNNSLPQFLYTFNGKMYFQATANSSTGNELYSLDSSDNVTLVKDLSTSDGAPSNFFGFNNILYFRAEHDTAGRELWMYDGKNPPQLVMDINPGRNFDGDPSQFIRFKSNAYFRATTKVNGTELWVLEGCKDTLHSYDTLTHCGPFTWIDGKTYKTSNDHLAWTTSTVQGCDSIVHLSLTINDTNHTSAYIARCDSFTWINGATYHHSTDTPTITLANQNGCDSIVHLHLTIHRSDTTKFNKNACSTYTWTDGKTYSKTGTYYQFLSNYLGCDSILILQLKIGKIDTQQIHVETCHSYTWTNGVEYKTSGSYYQYLTGQTGCDSVVILNLVIHQNNSSVDSISSCKPIKWKNGNMYYHSTDTPYVTYTNRHGCDSIVRLVFQYQPAFQTTEKIQHCGSIYTWKDGKTYTQNTKGSKYVLTSTSGCDSVLYLDLTLLKKPNTKIQKSGLTLQCLQYGAKYQWLDCRKSFAKISNATFRNFSPNQDGQYAVDIKLGQCRDTSECFIYGKNSNIKNTQLSHRIFPNPAKESVTITGAPFKKMVLRDLSGKEVKQYIPSIISTETSISLQGIQSGLYYLELNTITGKSFRSKLIIQK